MKNTLLASILLITGMISAAPGFELKEKDSKQISTRTIILKDKSEEEGIKGKFMLNAGAGYNLWAASLTLKYTLRSPFSVNSVTASPIFNFNCDYGLLRNVSVGVGAGFQGAQVGLNGYDDINNEYYDYYDYWKRIYVSIRGDYYIIAKDNVSLYTGLRLGYNSYTVSSGARSSDHIYSFYDLNLSPAIVHAHFGFSYYYKGIVGFNAEVGIGYGGPYIPAVGVAVKL